MNAPFRKKSYADSDVADPTIILAKEDSHFIESWEQRKARRLAVKAAAPADYQSSKPVIPSSVRQSNHKLDAQAAKKFADLWTDGAGVKYLARHFGIAPATVCAWRLKLGLPMRYVGRSKRAVGKADSKIAVLLTREEKTALGMRASVSHGNMSLYVRTLIRRDLGL